MEKFAEIVLSQYGFGVLISIIVCAFFYIILKWLLGHVDKLVALLEGYKASLDNLVITIKKYTDQSDESHKYQKDEHERMVKSLDGVQEAIGRINGYVKPRGE